MASEANVLLVDDSPDTRRLLTLLLKRWGYRAKAAASAAEAMAHMRESVPDLIILDVMMPDVDGLEVLRWVRAEPRTAAVPVILHTAVSDAGVREHAERFGATDYWVKAGITAEQMRQAIARCLPAN